MNIDLLKRLCETPGAPGHEAEVRALIEAEVAGLFDTVTTDPMGSLLCTRASRSSGGGPPESTPLARIDSIKSRIVKRARILSAS